MLFFLKKMKKMSVKSIFIAIVSVLIFSINSFAQTGTVRGIVLDANTGEEIIGVTVLIVGADDGTVTDFDGSYFLELPVGMNTLEFSFTGMATQTITDIDVKEGEVTVIDIQMKEETTEITTVVVEAKAITNSDGALMTMQKKSTKIFDAVSSQSISRTGDGDAGEAIARVTGVTVQGGKNVFVRGLGDRYTKTILNSMELPGLDPDRNTVQMDIFPTNILDNIIVYKTFTPDLSGDFTGGTVDISLKDFPSEKKMNFSASLGFNPYSNLNNSFLSHSSSAIDYLGLGADSRALPIPKNAAILIPNFGFNDNNIVEDRVKSFNKEMSADERMSFLNTSLGFSLGNQINKEKRTLGFNAALGYKNNYSYLEEAIFNEYLKDEDLSKQELFLSNTAKGPIGTQEVLWSALLNGSIKKKNNSYSLSLFHTQDGIKKTSQIRSEDYFSTFATLEKDILYYNQRNITNISYKQRHAIPEKKLSFNINLSPSLSMNQEPDIRVTAFVVDENGNYSLNTGDGGEVSRTYRDLIEYSMNGKFDTEWKFNQWSEKEAKLQGGIAYLYKERDFNLYNYRFEDNEGLDITLTGDPNQIFEDQNLFSATTEQGYWAKGNKSESLSYSSNAQIVGAYIMNELPITNKLKAIYGLRLEHALMRYTGQRQQINDPAEDIFDNREVLNELDFLPSLNLIYNLKEDMAIRTSYSRTLVRPSFKEKSLAQIIDPIIGQTFIGNLDLVQTHINNLDLRWEYFFDIGEMISFTTFYKKFIDPIEIVAFKQEAPNNITPRNVDQAQVLGFEFEFKKKLGFMAPSLENLSIGMNASYIYSQVSMGDAEYQSRLDFARTGETIKNTRVMQGQSPYIVNTYLNYLDRDKGIEANISYNVQGKRLALVGIGRNPDVYEQPFHNLSLKVGKRFGKDHKWRASVSAKNILNQNNVLRYESFGDVSEIYQFRRPGPTFSFGVSYSL